MALIGNYSLINRTPVKQFATGISSGYGDCIVPSGCNANRNYGGFAKFSATPVGYVHPASWSMAMTSGGLASFTGLSSSISSTDALLALGINIDTSMSASISTVDAILALIVALESSLSASGTLTDAQLAIILLLQSDILASGTLTNAQLGNILGLVASLNASISVSNSITNLVNLSSDIGGATPLSPEGLAAAVLSSEIEVGYSLEQALKLILSAVAGKVSGAATTTVTIKNILDNKNRIVATVDSNGNRTSLTYDVSD